MEIVGFLEMILGFWLVEGSFWDLFVGFGWGCVMDLYRLFLLFEVVFCFIGWG